ncbi:MAG: hypothetical protein EBR82_00055 [Caulobacteraceae bacterium]|nr:hypothetical protein [Caulobacteraceae bacterium]
MLSEGMPSYSGLRTMPQDDPEQSFLRQTLAANQGQEEVVVLKVSHRVEDPALKAELLRPRNIDDFLSNAGGAKHRGDGV